MIKPPHWSWSKRMEMWKIFFAEEIFNNLPNLKTNKGPKRLIGSFPKKVRIHQVFIRKFREVSSRWNRYWKFYYPEKWNVCPWSVHFSTLRQQSKLKRFYSHAWVDLSWEYCDLTVTRTTHYVVQIDDPWRAAFKAPPFFFQKIARRELK